MNLKDKIFISGLTDQGRVRDHNEDSIGMEAELGLLVLADGMGGHKGGEVASALAMDTVLKRLKQSLVNIKAGEIDHKTGYSLESMAIEQAIKEANSVIYQASKNNIQYEGMGTTIVVLLFYNNCLTVAHVGDSRLYRMRNKVLQQMTRDHSLLQELVDRGFYTKQEARKSLNKNLVTRALGVNPTVDVDLLEETVITDDIFLLCSDGLSDMIDDKLIEDTVLNYREDLHKAAQELINQANQHGGKDNVSAMLARPVKSFPANNNWFSKIYDLFS
jgi:protein phosphatase